jgi:hypothetical protein
MLADEIAEDSRQVNLEVEVFDLTTLNLANVENFKKQLSRFDLVICFNGIGVELIDSAGNYILNDIKATKVLWFVDDPAYYYERLVIPLHNKIILYPNSKHSSYIELINPLALHKPLLCGHPKYPANSTRAEDRETSIIVALSWHGMPQPFWESASNGNTRNVIEHTVEHLKNESELFVYDIFEYYFKKISGVSIAELSVNQTISSAICSITDYFRKLDRIKLVQSLGVSKLPITLVGNNWESICRDMPNIKIIPEVNYKDLQPFYASSKIVINTNAANGGCERAFSAIASGATVLSDFNSHLESIVGGIKKFNFYNRTSEKDIIQKISSLYYNSEDVDSTNTSELINENHLWRNRILTICEIYNGTHDMPSIPH